MMIRQTLFALAILVLLLGSANLSAAAIPVTDANLLSGLSAYNWVCKEDSINSTINGASLTVRLKGTRQVALQVATDHLATHTAKRFPIIAWSVNGDTQQSHQLAAGENAITLSSDIANPTIELYIKGMSPFEDRFKGDIPANSVKIAGLVVDDGGTTAPADLPAKVWLSIGDSIMSGDGAAYAKGQGRPPDDSWAASEDGRASYGYLLARHYGYRESRIAYGGYDWHGGMAGIPPLGELIEHRTSTVSRLHGELLDPIPSVVLINLGENGAPPAGLVSQSLTTVRKRVNAETTIIVMIPASGRGRAEITRAFHGYKESAKDDHAYLVDVGHITYGTCDGQHPTADGHRVIFEAAMPFIDPILGRKSLGRIMPLGDSITKGAPAGAYRDPLFSLLKKDGYSFQFVGTLTENPTPALLGEGQEHHQGHSGMGMSWIDDHLKEFFAAHSPDRILLAIGANDVGGADVPELKARMEKLIADIYTQQPKVKLYLSTITPQTGELAMSRILEFNKLIPGIVDDHVGKGQDVILVPMDALDLKDLGDNVHPNVSGSLKMAQAFHTALTKADGK